MASAVHLVRGGPRAGAARTAARHPRPSQPPAVGTRSRRNRHSPPLPQRWDVASMHVGIHVTRVGRILPVQHLPHDDVRGLGAAGSAVPIRDPQPDRPRRGANQARGTERRRGPAFVAAFHRVAGLAVGAVTVQVPLVRHDAVARVWIARSGTVQRHRAVGGHRVGSAGIGRRQVVDSNCAVDDRGRHLPHGCQSSTASHAMLVPQSQMANAAARTAAR